MYTAKQILAMVDAWKQEGRSPSEIIVDFAKACIGHPYVWGASGQYCTVSNRSSRIASKNTPEGEKKEIKKNCQRLNKGKTACDGCKYYPGGLVWIFDCRGFTAKALQHAGLTLSGGGATTQWNTAKNWAEKGEISTLPADKVCVLFWQDKKNPKKMAHTGLYIGAGQIIHESGEVKYDKISTKGWTHWAIPAGLKDSAPVAEMPEEPKETEPAETVRKVTIRLRSRGKAVAYAQQKLIALGYNLGTSGADGIFGNLTLAAVKAFQMKNGLAADGVIGPKTWAKLDA